MTQPKRRRGAQPGNLNAGQDEFTRSLQQALNEVQIELNLKRNVPESFYRNTPFVSFLFFQIRIPS